MHGGGGDYVDPFARVPSGHLIPSRIDMGVDDADNSPYRVLAIGDAAVSYAGPDPGWENGYRMGRRPRTPCRQVGSARTAGAKPAILTSPANLVVIRSSATISDDSAQ